MTWSQFGPVFYASLATSFAWGLTAFVLARLVGRVNVVDTMWSLGFVAIAAVAFGMTWGADGTSVWRRSLLLAGTAIWGLRLGWFVGRRSAGKGDDRRYVDLLERHARSGAATGARSAAAVAFVYAPQALILFVVSLTVQVGMAEHGPLDALGLVGVAVWALGIGCEAVGDHQMNRFRNDPDNHGHLIDTGLWRWTRHPNYFGDATVWTGLYLLGAGHWPGWLTVVSPLVMGYLLVAGSGKRLLERSMSKRDGWADYARSTSGFVPLPPALYRVLRRSLLRARAAG